MAEQFRILDVHHHVGDAMAAVGLEPDDKDGMSPRDYEELELAKRLEIMDAGDIEQAVVIPGHGYLRPNGHADTRAVNDRIAAYRDKQPDRFPVALGIVEPRDGDVTFGEIVRCKEDLGLAGISFHCRFQGVSIDNHWVRDYVEKIAEVGMVPVIHALDEAAEEALWKVGQLARKLPDVTILVLDGFATHEGTKHCAYLADLVPNVLFDTALSYNFDFIEDQIGRFGVERYVYGTDLYSWPLGRRISHIKDEILQSGLTDTQKSALLGGNARALFGVAS